MKRRTAYGEIPQKEHIDSSGVKKTQEVLAVGKLVSDNIATSVKKVGQGSVLRVETSGDTYLAFSNDSNALDAATINASYDDDYVIKLTGAGTFNVAAPANFVKASANPARFELIEE